VIPIRASFFDHARDNEPQRWNGLWSNLKTGLQRSFEPRPGNPGGDPKRSMPAISGAFYPEGVSRGRDNASGVSLLILDCDNSQQEPTGEFYPDPRTGEPTGRPKTRKVRIESPVTMDQVVEALQSAGIESVLWTTWSSSPEWEKFRAVVPLETPIPVDRWESFTEWALGHLGLSRFRQGFDIPVLRNPAALAFLPGSPTPETIRWASTTGEALFIPINEPPAPFVVPREPWQAAVEADRKAEWVRGERWFQVYRVDGKPVDFKSLDLALILEVRGVKVGQPRTFKDGTKRRAHCPWASEHTGGVDDDSAVLIHTPGTWPSFRCMHSGHVHMGLRDVIEWAWGRP